MNKFTLKSNSQSKYSMKSIWQSQMVKLFTILILSGIFGAAPVGAETYFFHNDHLGTPQALSSGSQQIVWRGNFKPFGNIDEPTNSVTQNLRFPGQYFDAETNLHYNYFRSYQPNTGRYSQSDPIGLVGGVNTYGYTLQNPIKFSDKLGLDVYVCGRPAELPWPLYYFNHEWILTDTLEAGMGPATGNNAGGVPAVNGNSDLPFTPVEIVDHSGESDNDENVRCDIVENIDENCVNSMLVVGTDLGLFGPTNSCQVFVTDVLIACSK